MNFGRNLQALRKSKKITTGDLAKALNMNVVTYRHYEFGISHPRLQRLVALASFLDVSVDYLLERSDDPASLENMRGTFYDLGGALRRLRENKGMGRKDVAAALGFPLRTYSQYEERRREPNLAVLTAFADYFGVSADEVLGRT